MLEFATANNAVKQGLNSKYYLQRRQEGTPLPFSALAAPFSALRGFFAASLYSLPSELIFITLHTEVTLRTESEFELQKVRNFVNSASSLFTCSAR
jgi:hypothetical protein